MNSRFAGSISGAAVVILLSFALQGCYYMQAARGQLEILRKSEPIDEVANATDTPAELARRLRLVEEARDFSIRELGLPDNDSYRSYADIEREFVVWNVFAAPEFSLKPREWCFPVAGCVAYRGYFSEDAAQRKARRLRADGLDVAVGGVPAYSTLGRFDDPVLSSMMRWEDVDLVATLFHELAHQVLYVKDDTAFNESFASVVAETGVERWLEVSGEADQLQAYLSRQAFRAHVVAMVESAKRELESLYRTRLATEEMRRRKEARLDALAVELRSAFEESGRVPPDWIGTDLNNARLASMALYQDRVPEFRQLLDDCEDDLRCFYAAARDLADADHN